jgi:hypothetical protein
MMLNRVPGKRSAVLVSAIADCPFSVAQDYALEYLRHIDLTTHLHRDNFEAGRRHDEIRVFWQSGSMLFPDIHGTVRLRIDRDRTRVLLEGTYAPRLGLVGRIFDGIAGKRIARATLMARAKRIAAYLGSHHAAWRLRVAV